jgi:hypothetical protein
MVNKMANYTILIIIIVIVLIGAGVGVAVALSGKKDDNPTGDSVNGIFNNTFFGDSQNYASSIKIASDRWSSYIDEDVTINVKYQTFNDPSSITLASASMNDSSNIRGGGTININTGRSPPAAGWDDVIEHELCHVLGLPSATEWQNAIITTSSGTFLDASVFTLTAAAYYDLISGSSGNIPLQSTGAHWNESVFSIELMTPLISSEPELITSKLTLTAMKELGWNIDLSKAEPFP